MSSLVLELQQEALNPSSDLTDLLRKALVVARKLGIKDFQTWTENELNGYPNSKDLPSYRKIRGTSQSLNPYHGWLPITFNNKESEDGWTLWTCIDPISEIIGLLNSKSDSNTIQVSYSPEDSKILSESIGGKKRVRLLVSNSSLFPILDSIKTIILNWAMKLEEDNILGKGLTFTVHEKTIAQSTTSNITNFYGAVSSSQIQQQTSDSIQSLTMDKIDIEPILKIITEIRDRLPELELANELEKELNAELDTVNAQAISPKPKPSILTESKSSIKRILESTASTIATELLIRLGTIPFS
ncbi:MAG: hypothetical protein PHQ86_08720 [Dehalococcoidales bacterium]|nr:hypothetical protein [Dehalococcoidales bacterium]